MVTRPRQTIDDDLWDWSELKDQEQWTGVLTGNGASLAIWTGFRYKTLYETALSAPIDHQLSAEDIEMFTVFDTVNFEQVLASLKTAKVINECLSYPIDGIETRYEHIQLALFESVNHVHTDRCADL
jgi:hypothetical protein